MLRMRRFREDSRGSFAVSFAVLLTALLGTVGAAIDAARLFQSHSALQSAADAAAIAAATHESADPTALRAVVGNFLGANAPDQALVQMVGWDVSRDAKQDIFTITVTGTASTVFMKILGMPTLNLAVTTRVERANPPPLDLVLAVDTTQSMYETLGSRTKIDALRTGAASLVRTVMASPHARVGLVPFALSINIGTQHAGKSWLSLPPPSTYESCRCPAGRQIRTPYACIVDGIAATCFQDGCAVERVCTQETQSWGGCVSPRVDQEWGIDFQESIAVPPSYQAAPCGATSALLDLTNNSGAVLTAINGLRTSGESYIPGGLLWGWNMLDPGEPLIRAMTDQEMVQSGGKKVLVLLTDGKNQSEAFARGAFGGIGAFAQRARDLLQDCPIDRGVIPCATYSEAEIAAKHPDRVTERLCDNIKREGIVIYTVAFGLTDQAAVELMRSCASDPSKAYAAGDPESINRVFTRIGSSLQQVRIIQ